MTPPTPARDDLEAELREVERHALAIEGDTTLALWFAIKRAATLGIARGRREGLREAAEWIEDPEAWPTGAHVRVKDVELVANELRALADAKEGDER